jgi:hypothetical protein
LNAALHDSLVDLLVQRLDNQLAGAQLVDWAVEALQQGIETKALILLAGMARDCSVYEAGPLLDRGLAELNLPMPAPDGLRRAYVGAVSRAMLAGNVQTDVALDRIHQRAVSPLNHAPDLAPWCFVWEGLHPSNYESLDPGQVEAEARRLAASWAEAYPPPGS